MKHLRWLPLAYLAGQHGFAIFAPYAALMMMLAHYMNRRQRRRVPVAAAVAARA